MNEILDARFNENSKGEFWVCPVCATTLARACSIEQLPSIEALRRGVAKQEKLTKTVPGLKLMQGYVFHEGRRMWVKPGNSHAFFQGRGNRRRRQETRARLIGDIDKAKQEGDLATIVDSQADLSDIELSKGYKGVSAGEEPDITYLLPTIVQCRNAHCRRTCRISVLRGY
jgi:hypothetical protein